VFNCPQKRHFNIDKMIKSCSGSFLIEFLCDMIERCNFKVSGKKIMKPISHSMLIRSAIGIAILGFSLSCSAGRDGWVTGQTEAKSSDPTNQEMLKSNGYQISAPNSTGAASGNSGTTGGSGVFDTNDVIGGGSSQQQQMLDDQTAGMDSQSQQQMLDDQTAGMDSQSQQQMLDDQTAGMETGSTLGKITDGMDLSNWASGLWDKATFMINNAGGALIGGAVGSITGNMIGRSVDSGSLKTVTMAGGAIGAMIGNNVQYGSPSQNATANKGNTNTNANYNTSNFWEPPVTPQQMTNGSQMQQSSNVVFLDNTTQKLTLSAPYATDSQSPQQSSTQISSSLFDGGLD
jgi:hypothetical protein